MIEYTENEKKEIVSKYCNILYTYIRQIDGGFYWNGFARMANSRREDFCGIDVNRLRRNPDDVYNYIKDKSIADIEKIFKTCIDEFSNYYSSKVNEGIVNFADILFEKKINPDDLQKNIYEFMSNYHITRQLTPEQIRKLYSCNLFLYHKGHGKAINYAEYDKIIDYLPGEEWAVGKTLFMLIQDDSLSLVRFKQLLLNGIQYISFREVVNENRIKQNAIKGLSEVIDEVKSRKTNENSDTNVETRDEDVKKSNNKRTLSPRDKMLMLKQFGDQMEKYQKYHVRVIRNGTIDYQVGSLFKMSEIEENFNAMMAIYVFDWYSDSIRSFSPEKFYKPGDHFWSNDFWKFINNSTLDEIKGMITKYVQVYEEKCIPIEKKYINEAVDEAVDGDYIKRIGFFDLLRDSDAKNKIESDLLRRKCTIDEAIEQYRNNCMEVDSQVDLENITQERIIKKGLGIWARDHIQDIIYIIPPGYKIHNPDASDVFYIASQIVSEISGGAFKDKSIEDIIDAVDLKTYKEYVRKFMLKVNEWTRERRHRCLGLMFDFFEDRAIDVEQQTIEGKKIKTEDIGNATSSAQIKNCEEALQVLNDIEFGRKDR